MPLYVSSEELGNIYLVTRQYWS